MSNWTKLQTLLRVSVVLSVVVLAAFTTNSAWAATSTIGDASSKVPSKNPLTNPQGQLCPNGVSMALEPNCFMNGANQNFSNLHGLQNRGSNSNTNTHTFNLNTNKTNSSSSSNNSLTQQFINIGKVPTLHTNGSTQVFSNKVNVPKVTSNNTNNLSKLTVNNGSNSLSITKDLSKLAVNNGSNSSSTTKDLSKLTVNNSSNSSSTTKDTTKLTNTKVPDPPSSNTLSREGTLIQSFEKLTGHNLSTNELKRLVGSDSLSSEGETRFVQRLETITGHELNGSQLSEVEGEGSQSVNSEGETALIQRFERITGHELNNSEINEIEGEGSLNSEGETQFIQHLENVTGHEISNSEISEVEGEENEGSESEGFENSEGESAETQEIENQTGQEIGNVEVDEDINGENAESTATQIAEGEIVPITGAVTTISTLSTIAGSVSSLNESNGVDSFQIGNTTVQVNSSVLGSNTLQNGLNIELDGTVASNGTFVANTLDALTNNATTVVSGTVSSLSESGTVDTFVIGNTSVRMSSTLLGSNTLQNGENIKVDGFYTDSLHFVVTAVESVGQ